MHSMKREITPDYIKGQTDMFKTIQKIYFLTDYDWTDYGLPFDRVMKTDVRTVNEIWEKWMLFGKHRLAADLVGHQRYKDDSLDEAEDAYDRCQYDPEYRESIAEDYEELRKALCEEGSK